ncbi:hypothetical protein VB005_05088 [Metarhizium brunneum]
MAFTQHCLKFVIGFQRSDNMIQHADDGNDEKGIDQSPIFRRALRSCQPTKREL